MARNVEIKARIDHVESLLARAQPWADGPPQRIEQDDTFFACAHGRLKLRDFGDGSGELIHYIRADDGGPKLSDYVRAPTSDAAALREALSRAHAVIGRVRKTRLLLLVGQTRIHLDRVHGLGDFMELEVVLRPEQSAEEGAAIAEALMVRLDIPASQRLAGAYLDLMSAASSAAGMASARKS
jgi:adenylate cyclase class IV